MSDILATRSQARLSGLLQAPSNISIERLSLTIGAEIGGVDLADAMDSESISTMSHAKRPGCCINAICPE